MITSNLLNNKKIEKYKTKLKNIEKLFCHFKIDF
jgi:hypothetical protein